MIANHQIGQALTYPICQHQIKETKKSQATTLPNSQNTNTPPNADRQHP